MDELTDLLEGESRKGIFAFQRAFSALLNRVNDFQFWECAYALNWSCSDDGFHYFCTGWIGQGKNKFYWSIRYPRLIFFFAMREIMQPYEDLEYCARQAYENLSGREPPTGDFEFSETQEPILNESLAVVRHPALAFLAW